MNLKAMALSTKKRPITSTEYHPTMVLRLPLWQTKKLTQALSLTLSLVHTKKPKTPSLEKLELRLIVKEVVSRETMLSSMEKRPLLKDKDLTISLKSSLKTTVANRTRTLMISALRSTKPQWRGTLNSRKI
jgi:hypothetical protein